MTLICFLMLVYQSCNVHNEHILLSLGEKRTHPKSCFRLGKSTPGQQHDCGSGKSQEELGMCGGGGGRGRRGWHGGRWAGKIGGGPAAEGKEGVEGRVPGRELTSHLSFLPHLPPLAHPFLRSLGSGTWTPGWSEGGAAMAGPGDNTGASQTCPPATPTPLSHPWVGRQMKCRLPS